MEVEKVLIIMIGTVILALIIGVTDYKIQALKVAPCTVEARK